MSKNYIIPKKINARYEFFVGFGKDEAIKFMIGVGVGVGLCFLLFLIQQLLFPLKAISEEELSYGQEFLQSNKEGIVLIKRNFPMILYFFICVITGALGAMPFYSPTGDKDSTIYAIFKLRKRFFSSQKDFYFKKIGRY